MTSHRLRVLTERFAALRIAVVGDFCLDRYLEIDPARAEVSIETGLPVHNVVRVRAQPGAAGTVLNNLVALGVGEIFAIGFCGEDGDGYELLRALHRLSGVNLEHFLQTPERHTFTYCKPLILEADQPPRELSRLDFKNWEATPVSVSERICAALYAVRGKVDAIIVLEQTDMAETGVITRPVMTALATIANEQPQLPIVADSRRGLGGYPPCVFKMNQAELSALTGLSREASMREIEKAAAELALRNQRAVVVTLAERGLIGATVDGRVEHVPAVPVRGPIDIVGAGDSVTASISSALAAGEALREGLELAALASSVVVHQLGTSGAASAEQICALFELLGTAD